MGRGATSKIGELKWRKSMIDSDAEALHRKLNSENFLRSGLSDALLNNDHNISTINFMVGSMDFIPVLGATMGIIDVPENIRLVRELVGVGEYGLAATLAGLSTLELVASGLSAGFVTKGVLKKLSAPSQKTLEKYIKIAELEEKAIKTKKKNAKTVANKNTELKKEMVVELAEDLDSSLVKIDKKTGEKVVDYDAVKAAGKLKAQEVMLAQNLRADQAAKASINRKFGEDDRAYDKSSITTPKDLTTEEFNRFTDDSVVFSHLTDNPDDLMSAILDPDKYDAMVAIASDLRAAYPKLWKKNKKTIDNLFDLTINKDLDFIGENSELSRLLDKYGLTFQDYAHTVVSGGSEAGRILQKLSQIHRADPSASDIKRITENKVAGTFKRIMNMRRGIMVSMFKTAMRNLESVFLRAPMDNLEKAFDNVLYELTENGFKAGAKSTVPRLLGGKKGTYDHVGALFRSDNKELSKYLLDRPEFARQMQRLFTTYNELQARTGNEKGYILPTLELGVHGLTYFNRWQDRFVRKSLFGEEIKRLVRQEYDLDLVEDVLLGKNKNQIQSFINGTGKFTTKSGKYKGKKSFYELAEESTRNALSLTYGDRPNLDMFNDFSNFMTRNSILTAAEPFPRFMFSAMEYIAETSFGAALPIIRKATRYRKRYAKKADTFEFQKNLKESDTFAQAILKSYAGTKSDRRQISRNLAGLTGITAVYWMRRALNNNTEEGVNEDPQKMNLAGIGEIDLRSNFPATQINAISQIFEKFQEGTLSLYVKNNFKELTEIFVGSSSLRTGQLNMITMAITEAFSSVVPGLDESDAVKAEKIERFVGRSLGGFLTSFLAPLNYIIDGQRILGYRPKELIDYRQNPYLAEPYFQEDSWRLNPKNMLLGEIKRTFEQRGYLDILNPEQFKDLDSRVLIYNDNPVRIAPILDMLGGIRITSPSNQFQKFFRPYGYNEWETGSQSYIGTAKRKENYVIKQTLWSEMDNIRMKEKILIQKWKEDTNKDKASLNNFLQKTMRPYLDEKIKDAKKVAKTFGVEELTGLLKEQYKWRKVFKKNREAAESLFRNEYGRDPNYSNIQDIQWLIQKSKGVDEN